MTGPRGALIVMIGEKPSCTRNKVLLWMEVLGYSRRASSQAISDLVLSGAVWHRHGLLRLRPFGQKMYKAHVEATGEV